MDPEAKKKVLRAFTYGLYVVGCRHDNDVNAFTANWLTQVSFDPPLIAVSVQKDGHSIDLIRASGVFTVAVLPSGSRELAGLLGKPWKRVPDKIFQVEHFYADNGCPVPAVALGYIECKVLSETDAGDSVVFIAEVVDAHWLRDGQPLTMAETGFRHAG